MPLGTPSQFGQNPVRGTPSTTLGRRTTAGSHRISHLRGGQSGAFTAKGRPISEFPQMFGHLRRASEGLPETLVRPLAEAIRDETARQGRRYKLRGHAGKPYPLEARTEAAMNSRGISRRSRFVVGVPAGFWRIVEEGSNRHLIAGRYRKGGGRFTSKGAASAFGFSRTTGALRDRGLDSAFNLGTPVNVLGHSKGQSNEGWAQYVDHPGHGPIGRPWRRAMNRSEDIMHRIQREHATSTFVQAFYR